MKKIILALLLYMLFVPILAIAQQDEPHPFGPGGFGFPLTKSDVTFKGRFNGRNDFVIIPQSPSLDIKDSVTLSARVRNDGDDDGQIIWRGDTRGGHDPYMLDLTQGKMEFQIDAIDAGRLKGFVVRSRENVDDKLHFWTGVYDKEAGMLHLYKDGVLEASQEISGTIDYDTSRMWNVIGAVDHGTWQHFRGQINEVRIWNVARTADEIRQDMNRRLTGEEEGLVACWRLEQGVGQIVPDISKNRNHGLLRISQHPGRRPRVSEIDLLEQQARILAEQYRQAEGQSKEELGEKLRAALSEIFEKKAQAQSQEVERLEKQLGKLRDRLEKRQKNREAIIGRRFEQLAGPEDDELAW